MSTLNSRLQLSILNRKKRKNLAEKGFTLIELLITVVILGTLSAIALPNFLGVKEAADGKSAIASATALAKECSTAIVADLSAAPTQTAAKGVALTTPCTKGGGVYDATAQAKDGDRCITAVAAGTANKALTNCKVTVTGTGAISGGWS